MDLFDSILSQHKVGDYVILSFRDVPKGCARFLLNACREQKPLVPDYVLENPDLAIRVIVSGTEGSKRLFCVGYNKTLKDYAGSASYPVYYVRNYIREDDAPLQCPGGFSDLLGGDTT